MNIPRGDAHGHLQRGATVVSSRIRLTAIPFFFQAEDGIRDVAVTGVQTCALPIWVPTDPRCLSPIPRATNSVARAVDGSLYRLRDEICLRYSSASSSTNATALTHKTHEFLHYFCDGK